jgi:hypothetical protein
MAGVDMDMAERRAFVSTPIRYFPFSIFFSLSPFALRPLLTPTGEDTFTDTYTHISNGASIRDTETCCTAQASTALPLPVPLSPHDGRTTIRYTTPHSLRPRPPSRCANTPIRSSRSSREEEEASRAAAAGTGDSSIAFNEAKQHPQETVLEGCHSEGV